MAASCISISASSVGGSGSGSGIGGVCQQRQLRLVGLSSRRLGEPLQILGRRPFEAVVVRSYGGYGAEAIESSDWAPPAPPNLDDLSEPSEVSSDFSVPTPDSRDYGGFAAAEPEPNTKLYVGNLAWSVDSSMLAECFKSVGIHELEEVNVMYDRMLGKSRGFAFVTLSSEEAAKQAIEKLDGYEFEGRNLRVNYPQVPRGSNFGGGGFGSRPSIPANPAKCFVANIPWSIDDQSLQEFFSSQGTVVDCRILTDADTGRSRGIGFVTFSTPEEANAAISYLDGADLGGRTLRVAMATGRQ